MQNGVWTGRNAVTRARACQAVLLSEHVPWFDAKPKLVEYVLFGAVEQTTKPVLQGENAVFMELATAKSTSSHLLLW